MAGQMGAEQPASTTAEGEGLRAVAPAGPEGRRCEQAIGADGENRYAVVPAVGGEQEASLRLQREIASVTLARKAVRQNPDGLACGCGPFCRGCTLEPFSRIKV